jgi:putative hemolysin
VRIGAPLDGFQEDSSRRIQGDRSCRVQGDRSCRVQGDPAYAYGITIRAQDAVVALSKPAATPAEEIRRLRPETRLIASDRFDVFHARAHTIPITLQEIGRLRALTFQAVGEGTGSAMDLDRFDDHYVHLFVWDRERACVVGAYRIGRTDRIAAEHGIEGLYTRTLFRYGTALLDAMPPALELGRSFVRPEYQRDYQPLLLLWRGIGRFLILHPHYRCLFGPVSISARYSNASQVAITAFLERHHRHASLSRLVEPRHGKPAPPNAIPLPTVAAVDQHVAALEADGKGMPVLLRQYLKLGAKVLGVSEDPSFGNVTDALMVVDLAAVSPAMLRRYLGEDGVARYSSSDSGPRLSPAA